MDRTFYEKKAFSEGYRFIAGVDEAGRGPLAGPVVAVACILPRVLNIAGINDSKQLTFKQREELYYALKTDEEVVYGIGIVGPDEIDEMNILKATLHAMALAIQNIAQKPDYLLVDGNVLPSSSIVSKAVIQGDCYSLSIGAAFILAKHTRDLLMIESHKQFPHYGFDQNKGYGTRMHREALKIYGPCPIHRKSFSPLKSLVGSRSFQINASLV